MIHLIMYVSMYMYRYLLTLTIYFMANILPVENLGMVLATSLEDGTYLYAQKPQGGNHMLIFWHIRRIRNMELRTEIPSENLRNQLIEFVEMIKIVFKGYLLMAKNWK